MVDTDMYNEDYAYDIDTNYAVINGTKNDGSSFDATAWCAVRHSVRTLGLRVRSGRSADTVSSQLEPLMVW